MNLSCLYYIDIDEYGVNSDNSINDWSENSNNDNNDNSNKS